MTILRRRTDSARPSAEDGRWEIWEQNAPAIRAYAARRVERDAVDDVVAEVFAIAWRKLPREADPLPWLYAVARRVVHGHRRSHARRGALVVRVGGHALPAAAAPDPAEQIHGDPALAQAFAVLTETEREAICLVAWEGLDAVAAARAAGCNRAAFAARLSRARARLRSALDAQQTTASDAPQPTALDAQQTSAPDPLAGHREVPPARRAARRPARPATSNLELSHDA